MAVDTLAKRNSAIRVSAMIVPIPDGTIAQADRQTVARVYGGILASAAVEANPNNIAVREIVMEIVEQIALGVNQ